jgi:RNA polymerase sigma factor (TIGR02999 family)
MTAEGESAEPAKGTSDEKLESEELFALLYEELLKYARSRMAHERPNHTLQATAVVNSLWEKLGAKGRAMRWNSRGHFFASMARSIRQILIDYAIEKNAQKRGGGAVRQPLDDVELVAEADIAGLLDLNNALHKLEKIDSQAARVVELRYFSGMTIEEIAEELGVSPRTVDRLWETARKWLFVELKSGRDDLPDSIGA